MGNRSMKDTDKQLQLPDLPTPGELTTKSPEGYFELLPDAIMKRIEQPKKTINFANYTMFLKFVAAAAIITGVWLGISRWILPPNLDWPALSYIELAQRADQHFIDIDMNAFVLNLDDDAIAGHMESWLMNYSFDPANSNTTGKSFTKDEIIDYLFEFDYEQTTINL
ncbi:MAG: hypothetical protein U1C46_04975 [Bacteroidales bacterium]|nr:hypothetical protein [Bacteroidales bacterium]